MSQEKFPTLEENESVAAYKPEILNHSFEDSEKRLDALRDKLIEENL